MSPEVALLNEVWEIMKGHVPQKERLHEAERLLRLFEENIDIGDIDMYKNEFDKVMKTAIVSYYDEGVDDEDEFDDEYYD
jgi:hypothetical protein